MLRSTFAPLFAALLAVAVSATAAGRGDLGDGRAGRPADPPWLLGGNASADGVAGFELSAWVDASLAASKRGYWERVRDRRAEPRPDARAIGLAKRALRRYYAMNQLYVVYHRQFEPKVACEVLGDWARAPIFEDSAPYVVPALVLQDYATGACNFSDAEIELLVACLRDEVNSAAIAVYEVFDTSRLPERHGCGQLSRVRAVHGGEVIRLGLQPGEPLDPRYDRAVIDAYAGIATGATNTAWSERCGVGGHASGKAALAAWAAQRVGEARTAWNLLAVGFDYSLLDGCGDDGQEADEPVPPGRNLLAEAALVAAYPGGGAHPDWGGFSVDLKILHVHSTMWDAPGFTLYDNLARNGAYGGRFSAPLEEIRSIYRRYNVRGRAAPLPAMAPPGPGPAPGGFDDAASR